MGPTLGMATYGREPLAPQAEEAAALGFDYLELDFTGGPGAEGALLAALGTPLHPPPRTAHLFEVATPADLKRALGLVDRLAPRGVRVVNLHLPGEVGLGPSRRQVDLLAALADHCRTRGVVLAAENTWEGPEAMAAVFDQVEGLALCLDLGHANLYTSNHRGPAFLDRLGDRLRLVHLSDNLGGTGDLHLPLGRGTAPLIPLLGRLAARGYEGPITLEVFTGGPAGRAGSLALVRRLLPGGPGPTAGKSI